MRKLTLFSLMLFILAPTAVMARNGDPVPYPPISVNVKNVFAPVGFDDNDEVEIVLDGYLPDTCYKLAFSRVTFDESRNVYQVRQYARKPPGICLPMIVPFTTEVRIGPVKAGDYKIESIGAETQSLEVNVAIQNGPDDFLYAPVDSARVDMHPDSDTYTAVIAGRLTNTCMSFVELRLIDTGRTLQLLPIVKLAEGADCQAEEVTYEKTVRLPTGMSVGRHLLHVRSLNGKAQNAVFTVGSGTRLPEG